VAPAVDTVKKAQTSLTPREVFTLITQRQKEIKAT
jgi:hypothetical protein